MPHGDPRLTGTLRIALGSCRSVPPEFGGRIHLHALAVVVIAVLTSWFVAVLFTPLSGRCLPKPPKHDDKDKGKNHHESGGRLTRLDRRRLLSRMRNVQTTLAVNDRDFGVALWLARSCPASSFPRRTRPELVPTCARHDASIDASDTASQKSRRNPRW